MALFFVMRRWKDERYMSVYESLKNNASKGPVLT